MSVPLQYETPENVQIEYRPAGPGTRYLAWLVDSIIINLVIILAVIVLAVIGAMTDGLIHKWFEKIGDSVRDKQETVTPEQIALYFVGIAMLLFAFGSFLYFGLSELLWRGQTVGKRLCRIRVVKTNGFALDLPSIFMRNIFRVVDNFSALWIVPVLSKRGQRLGDMVAGTVVVNDEAEELAEIRAALSNRNAAEARFRFDNARLSRLTPQDFDAIERILDRWNSMPKFQQVKLLGRMFTPLCMKLSVEQPAFDDRVGFLEDLLAADYRRQDRHLR